MSKPRVSSDVFIELFVTGLGPTICMVMVAGFYWLGSSMAGYLEGEQHRDTFGILSVIVIIWFYEHRRAEERLDRLSVRIDEAASAAH